MKQVHPHSRFFIIGNADEQHSIAHLIKKDDIIIRFNMPNPTCSVKADWTFIANGPVQLNQLHFTSHNLFKPDMRIFFRYTTGDIWHQRYQNFPLHKRIKYYWRFPKWIKRFHLDQYSIETVPGSIFQHYMKILDCHQPSTGLLAIAYVMQHYSQHTIYIHNFTHEGWTGHNWNNEKQIMQHWLVQQKIYAV